MPCKIDKTPHSESEEFCTFCALNYPVILLMKPAPHQIYGR